MATESRIWQRTDTPRRASGRRVVYFVGIACFVWIFAIGNAGKANDLDRARELVRVGEYEQAIDLAKEQVAKRVWNEAWPRLLIDTYLTIGKF
nr:hypothetical protein [Pirellula sp.]